MTKNESPTNQSKLPLRDLFSKASLGQSIGSGNKQTPSSKNKEMLAYFNAISGEQRSAILKNLRADKEEEKFLETKIENETIEASVEEIAKAELYDNIMAAQCKQDLQTKYGSGSVPSHPFASKPSQELLAMATSLPTQFARFSKVLPNP
jgi:hypothetical protein